jgi:uncharacterized membrane protein
MAADPFISVLPNKTYLPVALQEYNTKMMSLNLSSFLSLFLVTLVASPLSVCSFTSPSLMAMPQRSAFSYPMRKADLLRASTAADGSDDDNVVLSDRRIQKLERKEAQLDKKRAQAMDQLNQLEETLTALKSQKLEYLNGVTLEKNPPEGNFSETTVRSAVKAFIWRVIAGSVTFVTSLRFSGSVATALTIVGSDFFSKSFTMFIGERLMNKSQAGRKSGADGAGRSLVKALVWRLFAIVNTLTMAIFIAKDITMASKIAGSDAIFKTGLMFFYERVWAKIEWGKEYQVEFNI